MEVCVFSISFGVYGMWIILYGFLLRCMALFFGGRGGAFGKHYMTLDGFGLILGVSYHFLEDHVPLSKRKHININPLLRLAITHENNPQSQANST